jgi:hypothetical protein
MSEREERNSCVYMPEQTSHSTKIFSLVKNKQKALPEGVDDGKQPNGREEEKKALVFSGA